MKYINLNQHFIFCKQTLYIYQQHLNANDPSSEKLYNNIGVTHGRTGNSELQLNHYGKAREIFLKASHANHQQISMINDNIIRAKNDKNLFKNVSDFS